jgi:hypothetical protein
MIIEGIALTTLGQLVKTFVDTWSATSFLGVCSRGAELTHVRHLTLQGYHSHKFKHPFWFLILPTAFILAPLSCHGSR